MNWIDELHEIIYIKINDEGVTEICESEDNLNEKYDVFYITVVYKDRMVGFVTNATDDDMANKISMYYSEKLDYDEL